MTSPTIVQNAHASNASAGSSLTLGTVSGASAGDLIIAWAPCERATATAVITDGGPTGWTLLQNNTNTNHTNGIYWKRLASGDLSAVVVATPSGAVTRRMAGGFIVLHGSADPVINNKTAVTSATTAASANAMTPSVADSLLLTLFSSCAATAPFARTFGSHTSSFLEQSQDTGTAAASTNPFYVISSKALTGGNGSQTFDAVTISSASEYNATSFVMAPNSNLPPTATLTASATSGVTAGATVTLTLGGTDDVAVTSGSLVQLSGPTATPTLATGSAGMPGATYTFTAPSVLGGTTVVYGYTTSDGSLSSSQATVSIDINSGTSGAPTIVQSGSASLASSAASLTLGALSTVSVGDLVLAWGTAERNTVTPTINGGSAPWTSLVNLSNTNHVTGIYWKRVTTPDLTMTITAQVSSTRRMSGGFVVLHHSLDPVINTKTAVTTATTAASANSMTPTVADSLLMTLFTSVSIGSAPWVRTFSAHTSGFTELLQVSGSASSSSNPFSVVSTLPLIGWTSSQTFDAVTISSASEYNAVSFVFAPGTVNLPPTASISASQTDAVEPGKTITLTLTDGDDIAVITRTLRQSAGTTATVTGSGGTRTFDAPYTLAGDILTFGYKVNDGTFDSPEAFVTITVLASDWRIVTVGGPTPTEVPFMIRIV